MNEPVQARVLIAEDDILISEMILLILEQSGYRVAGRATDGGEAIEMARTLQPDVVLMDLELSGAVNGLEATRQIRACCPTVPVIVLTAYDSPDLRAEAEAAGAMAYLVKPATGYEVIEAIKLVLGGKEGG